MSDLRNKIKELKKRYEGYFKALGVAGAVAFSSLGNEAKAETPKTKDSEEVKKEYHMSQEMPSSKLVSNVKDVQLDSLTTPELLDYLIEIGPKRVKKFSDNETEYSVPFGGGKRVAKVINSDGSYFYGISVGKNAAGRVDVDKLRDISCMNGAYSLCIRPDGTFYEPDYTLNGDKGLVERTDYKRRFKGNVHDTDKKLRDMAKKTITTIQRNKENKKTYQLTNQDYAKMRG